MKRFIFLAGLVSCCLTYAQGFAQVEPNKQFPKEGCGARVTFDTPESNTFWQPVNDGVMGGLSSGGPKFENDLMIFRGVINTNGGGFSSVRAPVLRGYLDGMSGIKLRVKSDGRAYKFTFRTRATYYGRSVSFQKEFPAVTPGEWTEIDIPFSELKATVFGRSVGDIPFQAWDVRSNGIILADGKDGPFKLEVEWLEVCK